MNKMKKIIILNSVCVFASVIIYIFMYCCLKEQMEDIPQACLTVINRFPECTILKSILYIKSKYFILAICAVIALLSNTYIILSPETDIKKFINNDLFNVFTGLQCLVMGFYEFHPKTMYNSMFNTMSLIVGAYFLFKFFIKMNNMLSEIGYKYYKEIIWTLKNSFKK